MSMNHEERDKKFNALGGIEQLEKNSKHRRNG